MHAWSSTALAILGALSVSAIVANAAAAADDAPARVVAAKEQAPPGRTLGLVAAGYRFAIHETADAKECPHGFNVGQRANYYLQFPTPEAREAQQRRFGYAYGNRGPAGENVFFNPTAATDPPLLLSEATIAPGLDLDGKVGPEDFSGPAGERGIDNQLQRVLGCIEGARTNGNIWYSTWLSVRTPAYRSLIQLSDVDDLRNDPDVTVTFLRGLDPTSTNTDDQPIAGGTQRIDVLRGQRYLAKTRGRIVNGVLTTDPVDVIWPWNPDLRIRALRLRVDISSQGAVGLLGGYADLESFYFYMARRGNGTVADVDKWSPPALYRALHENADAYPDATGVNTAISMALSVQFVSTFIRAEGDHPRIQSAPANYRTAQARSSWELQ